MKYCLNHMRIKSIIFLMIFGFSVFLSGCTNDYGYLGYRNDFQFMESDHDPIK